jgi:hypothetical protein
VLKHQNTRCLLLFITLLGSFFLRRLFHTLKGVEVGRVFL